MSKKLWIVVVVVVLVLLLAAALAFPLSNLSERVADPALVAQFEDPEAQRMVELYTDKCLDCHSVRGVMPLYAELPIASDLIAGHIEEARTYFDMDREMFDPVGGVTEASLAKAQHETAKGAMPPPPYTALHWNARWDDADDQQQAAWARHLRARNDGAEDLDDPIYDLPIYPLKAPTGLDRRKVRLGEALYHDVRLSGDDTISCASCHDLTKGGTDQERVSTGVDGQLGGINSPTTFNSVYFLAQFWDGRAADLVEQADGPPNNPIEMATSWDQVLGKLSQDEAMVAAFAQTYGHVTADGIKDAIAKYEKTLVTTGDRLDRFLPGDEDALTAEQQAGWAAFREHGCDTCHVGAAMGGTSYEKMGLHGDYMSDRGDPTDADLGRFAVTDDEQDKGHFKVPTLRNIELTFPYYHDGTVETLEGAVQKMGHYERGRQLSDAEVSEIVSFLGALTGEIPAPPVTAVGQAAGELVIEDEAQE